jgi:Bacterial extracellular solute-binding proteins, family 3
VYGEWRTLAVLVLALLAVALILPAGAQATDKIVVGTSPDYPPFEQLQHHNKAIGFDIDLVREIAERAGFNVKWRMLPFPDLFPAITNGILDMVASAATIVPAREEFIGFSAPYFYAADDPAPYQYYGFGFPKGSPLRGVVNAALQQTKDDGTYVEIYVRWFGVAAPVNSVESLSWLPGLAATRPRQGFDQSSHAYLLIARAEGPGLDGVPRAFTVDRPCRPGGASMQCTAVGESHSGRFSSPP